MPDDYIPFAPRVTRRHAMSFCELMDGRWEQSSELQEAVELSGIMEWPAEDEGCFGATPAQERFWALEEEILARVFEDSAVQGVIAATFLRVAREVVQRERDEQRRRKSKRSSSSRKGRA